MGFSCGIIGLPNVGKSTIFNALSSGKAAAANFPFCTIEPNTGAVAVPDPRLNKLAELAGSKALIPTQITFVDIAGLIKGASKGEGLGNQFLGHIKSVDAVAHVIRCFENADVVHVEGTVDPIRDAEIIELELTLADLELVDKRIDRLAKLAKSGNKEAQEETAVLDVLKAHLSQGKSARSLSLDERQIEISKEILSNLLTAKPMLYVANVSEAEASTKADPAGSRPVDKLAKYAANHKSELVVISGQLESEISELDPEERKTYLAEAGLETSGLDRLALAGYKLLDLVTFFTIGPKEAHAWTMSRGGSAPQAAGKIHTDFEKGFIRAEIIGYQDYIDNGTELKAKEAGKLRVEGKEYIVQDGDVVHFRFNV